MRIRGLDLDDTTDRVFDLMLVVLMPAGDQTLTFVDATARRDDGAATQAFGVGRFCMGRGRMCGVGHACERYNRVTANVTYRTPRSIDEHRGHDPCQHRRSCRRTARHVPEPCP